MTSRLVAAVLLSALMTALLPSGVHAGFTDYDLSVTLSDAPDPVFSGQQLTYTISVAHSGEDSIAAVGDDLSGTGTTFVSATASQGTCAHNPVTNIVTCGLGTMSDGDTATITLVVTAGAPGVISNTAHVSGTGFGADTDPNDNSDTESTVVLPTRTADLAITKADAPDPVVSGQPLTYTLTATNNGTGTGSTVRVVDNLPAGATFVSAVASQGTCSHLPADNDVTCTLGSLAAGASVTITVVVTAGPPGTITNTSDIADADAGWVDPSMANNVASVETTVVAPASPAASSPTPVPTGSSLPDTAAGDRTPLAGSAWLLLSIAAVVVGAFTLLVRTRAARR